MLRRFLLFAALAAPACAPQACTDADERALTHDVGLLASGEGEQADQAAARLRARGRPAIVYLEAGLYEAEPAGRRRIIRALADLGDREALPILDHLARRDADEEVRAAAAAARQRLAGP